MTTSDRFFADLPPFEGFAGAFVAEHYADLPDDWCVAITDVAGSTQAIEAGRYKDVNALGAASIVAVLNAADALPLPYVFGGDGATLLYPVTLRPRIEHALRGVRRLASERFDLELRIGVVPMAELRADGFPVQVARYRASPHITLAMLSGSGLTEAERRIKEPALAARYTVADPDAPGHADLEGFECRWEPLISRHGSMVSLLVQAIDATAGARTQTYCDVLAAIDAALGDVADANPAHPATLHIAANPAAFTQEARLRGGRDGVPFALHQLKARALATVGRTLLRTGWRLPGFDGARYRDEVVVNTDFRKFDEMLRMVVDVSAGRLAALRSALDQLQAQGRIAYGLHASGSALMTCLIVSHEGEHVHFVDGADGGYAMAAVPLKAKLRGARRDATRRPLE